MNLTSVPWCSLEDRTLELTYHPEAENALQELLVRERKCCVTLQFDLARSGLELKLTVTLPASTGSSVEAQFAPFRAAKSGADVSCCGTGRARAP